MRVSFPQLAYHTTGCCLTALTYCVGLDGLDGVVHVLDGGGGGGQVVDLVHLHHQRDDDVMVNQLKVLVTYPA